MSDSMYVYIYMCVCICVCVCACTEPSHARTESCEVQNAALQPRYHTENHIPVSIMSRPLQIVLCVYHTLSLSLTLTPSLSQLFPSHTNAHLDALQCLPRYVINYLAHHRFLTLIVALLNSPFVRLVVLYTHTRQELSATHTHTQSLSRSLAYEIYKEIQWMVPSIEGLRYLSAQPSILKQLLASLDDSIIVKATQHHNQHQHQNKNEKEKEKEPQKPENSVVAVVGNLSISKRSSGDEEDMSMHIFNGTATDNNNKSNKNNNR